ncbi:hypothetical protein [Microbacterium sp. AK031]|uniref:hypothetical protein n=1 Tax=Microbacterium sp. AK031 TaxID=2723076 RepID=UPI002169743F|nr:hypothetical protein [Microbacterium sp. AK031]MCS3844659.1 hypothetical protein [Microbacterium sp. AK031]
MRDVAPPSDQDDGGSAVLIVIVRTGGLAGMRRRWHVEPPREEAPRWIELIDHCPWDAPDPAQSEPPHPSPTPRDSPQPRPTQPSPTPPSSTPTPTPRGADRFVWSIRARTPAARLERELPDSALDGPWRRLVEAVREASAS